MLDRFTSNLDLVDIIARQVGRAIGQTVELEELVSFGREGLLAAARRYERSRGVPFRAYANFRVRGAVLDGVRAMSRLPRRIHQRIAAWDAANRLSEGAAEDVHLPPVPGVGPAQTEQALAAHLAGMATAMAIGLVAGAPHTAEGEGSVVPRVSDPEEILAKSELLRIANAAIDQLSPDEAALLRRHYLQGERFDHVAAELGLSKSWASRLHTRAIRKLTKRLRGLAR